MPSLPPILRTRATHEQARGTAIERGYDHTWHKLRNSVLADEPCCRMCVEQGRVTIATMVDHIQPVRVAPWLRLVRSNLQPLCDACHRVKTRAEGGC